MQTSHAFVTQLSISLVVPETIESFHHKLPGTVAAVTSSQNTPCMQNSRCEYACWPAELQLVLLEVPIPSVFLSQQLKGKLQDYFI